MDETDRRLLALLAADARKPVAALAAALGLARSTVQTRIDRLEQGGVIAGYTLRLGDRARHTLIRATVLLQLDPRRTPGVLARLRSMDAVERAHTASGRFDLILTVSAPDPAALDACLDAVGEIDGVRATESLIHLTTRIDRAAQ